MQKILFFSDGFVPPILLAFLGALNLCKATMDLVLNKALSQQLREGRSFFPSDSILGCISSISSLYLFLHFLP